MENERPIWPEEELSQPKPKEREVSPDPVAEKPQAFSVAEGELAAEAIKKQPIVAFERSSKAAEVGEPLEGQLDRKEIKDEPGGTQQAVSIGSLIDDLPARQPNLAKAVEPTPDSSTTPVITTTDDEDDTDEPHTQIILYSQAIRAGFISALVLIFVFTLLIILT